MNSSVNHKINLPYFTIVTHLGFLKLKLLRKISSEEISQNNISEMFRGRKKQ